MEISVTNSAIPAILGASFGVTSATYLFKRIIGNRYGALKAQSKHARIYYWCGLLAFISIGMGFTTIASEVAYGTFNSATIRGAELAKGTLQLTCWPVILLIISFVLSKFVKERRSDIENEAITVSPQLNNVSTSKYFYFIAAATLALSLYLISNSSNQTQSVKKSDEQLKLETAITSASSNEKFSISSQKSSSTINQKSKTEANTKVAFYENSIDKNCNSPFKTKPLLIEELIVDVANKKVISKYETVDGEKGIKEKSDCIVIDKNNWSCGGTQMAGPLGGTFAKASVIDGKYSYIPMVNPHFPSFCPPKIEILN